MSLIGRRGLVALGVACVSVLSACSSDGDAEPQPVVLAEDCAVTGADAFVCNLAAAAQAVNDLLGEPQQFFEVTANAQATSVFVALDDATAAQQYIVFDGVAEPLGEVLDGASGRTFTADAVIYDPAAVLESARAALPTADFVALSVEGGPNGSVRYVMATASGAISVALDGDGLILAAVD